MILETTTWAWGPIRFLRDGSCQVLAQAATAAGETRAVLLSITTIKSQVASPLAKPLSVGLEVELRALGSEVM